MARAMGDLVAGSGALEPSEGFEVPADFNVAPTRDIAVVLERLMQPEDGGGETRAETRREIHQARWGLVPPWAKDLSFSSRAFNARSETVATKPTFRSAVRARRCAIPVDGYYEWLKPQAGSAVKHKRPFFVHRSDDSLIFFAGLYEWWKDPEVAAGEPGRWVLSTTILTAPSPDAEDPDPVLSELGELHDRLPLPMNTQMMDTWLRPGKLGSADEAEALVEQLRAQADATASQWTLREVDRAVGNVRNNGPELVAPIQPSTDGY